MTDDPATPLAPPASVRTFSEATARKIYEAACAVPNRPAIVEWWDLEERTLLAEHYRMS